MKKNLISLLLLLIILCTGFFIRYQGIPYGFPLITHPDEPHITHSAFRMIEEKTFHPNTFIYPGLYIYMQALVYYLLFTIGKFANIFKTFSEIPITTLYFSGRLLTVLVSMATIFMTYYTGKKLFNVNIGIMAALFSSFSYLHIVNSYMITVDSPMAFWGIISFYISVLHFVHGPKWQYYIINGICIGLGIGTKYTAGWIIIPLLYSHLYHSSFRWKSFFDKKLMLCICLIPFSFILTTPYLLIDFKKFLSFMKLQFNAYSRGHAGYESDFVSYLYYLEAIVEKYGLFQLIMSFIGTWGVFQHNKKKAFLVICFPLFYFLFFGAFRVHFDRNMVILIPFLSLLAGYGIFWVIDTTRRKEIFHLKRTIQYALMILLFCLTALGVIHQAKKSLAFIHEITLPDTRYVSKIWIEEHLPQGSKVGREHYTPPIDTLRLKVKYLGFFGLMSKVEEINDLEYIIASSYDYDRFLKDPKQYPWQSERYINIFQSHELIKEFIPDKKTTSGPVIRIYKIKKYPL